jgi:hypothetical protein
MNRMMRFQVLIKVNINIGVLCDLMPCSLVDSSTRIDFNKRDMFYVAKWHKINIHKEMQA